MKTNWSRWLIFVSVLLALSAFVPPLRAAAGLVTIDEVSAGYDSYFREDDWLPLRVRLSNNGGDLIGRLVVRPETSGNGVSNTFSLPISLPAGSRKTAFLYITAHSSAQNLHVELLDSEDLVYATSDVAVTPLQRDSALYVVITSSTAGSIDLTKVATGGSRSFQGNWSVDNIPDHPASLDAVDLLVFTDVDTGTLTAVQHQTIADWVMSGGHLLVTGGPNWQATAVGLTDLLPLVPDASQTVDDVSALLGMSGTNDALSGQALLATGKLQPGAQVLATTGDNLPLVVRRFYGSGTVDYLALDPNTQPLRGWTGMNGVWFTLLSSVQPRPSWGRGFVDWSSALDAVEILPGLNLLPQVLALCVFLGAYIGLVGPLNYLVLARLNRREWAWVTIPLLILAFSVAAWILGFNLRGNEVNLSRVSVVQSWQDTDRARVDQLVGLLSPRRATYSLSVTDGRMLRPIPRTSPAGLFTTDNTDIRQTDVFSAHEFPVDASFIASFHATGMIAKPAITGKATLTYGDDGKMQRIRGSVRNDSQQTITEPVILARGVALQLNKSLAPNDVATFDDASLILTGEGQPGPAAIEPPYNDLNQTFLYGSYTRLDPNQTASDIMGRNVFLALDRNRPVDTAIQQQEAERRQSFLQSFMLDQYGSTSRGNRVYLAGWTNTAPLDFEVDGANWRPSDSTLYLVELQLDFDTPPASKTVFISPDQFTWVTRERTGLAALTGPRDVRLNPGDDVVFQFTPLPNTVLRTVDELTLLFDQSTSARRMKFQLWDWHQQTWTDLEVTNTEMTIFNPTQFLGPQNAVQVRLFLDGPSAFMDVAYLAVSQRGTF